MHFSHLNPSHLLLNLCTVLHSMGICHMMAEDKMKVTFESEKTICLGEHAGASVSANSTDQTSAPTALIEKCAIQATIGQITSEQRSCIEFRRVTGSAALFYEIALSVRKELSPQMD